MDRRATAYGVVALDKNGSSTPIGGWRNDTLYTVIFFDLDWETEYTVSVAGFKDVAGNVMLPDSTNRFTTGAEPIRFNLWGKETEWEKTPLNWFLLIVCFGWIWMAF